VLFALARLGQVIVYRSSSRDNFQPVHYTKLLWGHNITYGGFNLGILSF